MTAIEILRDARALILKGWSRGAMYRDNDGHPCDRDNAFSYCSSAAIRVAANIGDGECAPLGHPYHEAVGMMRDQVPGRFYITHYNDDQTSVRPMVAAFDRAIEAAERQTA